MYIKDIEDACRKVLNGDEEALKVLGLDNASYPVPKPQSSSALSLQANYHGVLNTAVAAREQQLSFLEKQCELTMQYMQTIAAAKNVKLQHEVDAEDVTEIMLALINEERKKYSYKDAAAEPSESEGGEDEETPECEEREAESRTEDESEKEEGKGDEKVEVEEELDTQSEEEEQIRRPKKRRAVVPLEDTESQDSEEESLKRVRRKKQRKESLKKQQQRARQKKDLLEVTT